MRNFSLPPGILPPGLTVWAESTFDLELVLLGASLLVLVFLGFWMVLRVRRWKNEVEAKRLTPQQQLEHYRTLLEEGLLEPQEFEELRQRLAPRSVPGTPPDNPPSSGEK